MFMDILPTVAQVGLVLQKQDVDIAAINPGLTDLKDKIKQAKKGKAFYQREFNEKLNVKKGKDETVKEVLLKGQKLELGGKTVKHLCKEVDELRETICEKYF